MGIRCYFSGINIRIFLIDMKESIHKWCLEGAKFRMNDTLERMGYNTDGEGNISYRRTRDSFNQVNESINRELSDLRD